MKGLLRRIWYGFVGLFGLNACPTPPPAAPETPSQRQARERLERRLRGDAPAPKSSAPSRQV
ncbi:MAG TPA: hypothetical protein VKB51_05085 [bacterium]|nr:hypothetical protein [bacterium]